MLRLFGCIVTAATKKVFFFLATLALDKSTARIKKNFVTISALRKIDQILLTEQRFF